MTRKLKVKATPLGPDHILGLREQFATAQSKGAQLTWDHGFGFGITAISLEVKFPDGTRHTEIISLNGLMQEWATQVINEHEQVKA